MFVSAYEVGQAFGGPEEGGWYYDVGSPVKTVRVPRRIAKRVAAKMELKFPMTRKRYSVNGGEDHDVFIENDPPRAFPEQRPQYS